MEGKIVITNMVNAQVTVNLRDMHFVHTWEKKGDKFNVTQETLEYMMYDNGVRYMFETGILYVEDLEAKIKVGLEPEGATEPVNIIVLTEAQKKRLMTIMPIYDFKTELEKVSNEQVIGLAQYAIQNRYADFDKFEYIKARTGIDCLKAIQMEKEAKEV